MKEWKYFVVAMGHRYCGKALCFIGRHLYSEKLLDAALKQMNKAIENARIFRDLRDNK